MKTNNKYVYLHILVGVYKLRMSYGCLSLPLLNFIEHKYLVGLHDTIKLNKFCFNIGNYNLEIQGQR